MTEDAENTADYAPEMGENVSFGAIQKDLTAKQKWSKIQKGDRRMTWPKEKSAKMSGIAGVPDPTAKEARSL